MTKKNTYVGPCATASIQGAGTDAQNDTFDRIIIAAAEHAAREAGLPGRVDRAMIYCRVCRAETSNDCLCDTCIEAGIEIRACERCGQEFAAFGAGDVLCLQCLEEDARCEERAAALSEMCRIHRVQYVEDLPPRVLKAHRDEWGRC